LSQLDEFPLGHKNEPGLVLPDINAGGNTGAGCHPASAASMTQKYFLCICSKFI